MFTKIKKVLKDLDTLFLLFQAHADDIKELKADIESLKPKKKKPVAKAPVKK